MSVAKMDRKESKVEFDNTYFKIYEDVMRLTILNFGADKEFRENYGYYLSVMSSEVMKTVSEIGRHIRIANSIYPVSREEYLTRRMNQEIAIGLCFDLLTKYQLIMKTANVRDNKYVCEIKNISHEINCLKNWRSSDSKRFKDIG